MDGRNVKSVLRGAFAAALTPQRCADIAEAFTSKCAAGDAQAFKIVAEVLSGGGSDAAQAEALSMNEKAELIRKAAEALAEVTPPTQ